MRLRTVTVRGAAFGPGRLLGQVIGQVGKAGERSVVKVDFQRQRHPVRRKLAHGRTHRPHPPRVPKRFCDTEDLALSTREGVAADTTSNQSST